LIGKTISHYKILEKLGEGGMGVVYKAHDTKLDREVAIKFLPPNLSSDPEAVKRFEHEAKTASALNHSAIGVIYEIDETDDGQTFIAMAYYEGGTLRERIDSGSLTTEEAVTAASQIASGLARAHEKGIVHRDIKPQNILLTRDGEAKIIDFGLAKLAGRTKLTRDGSTLGTAAYMSPEQARGEEVDHRSDIFSLGTILYEMLAGETPFKGEHEAAMLYGIVHEEHQPLSESGVDIPAPLQEIVNRTLEKDPDKRYQNALEFNDDIVEFRGQTTGHSGAMMRTGRTQPRRRMLLLGIAGAAIIVTLAAVLWPRFRKPAPAEGFTLAVVDFNDVSASGDSTRSIGMAGLIHVGLVENSPCRVVSPSYLQDIRRRLFDVMRGPIEESQALEVARESGATVLLSGQMGELDGRPYVVWQLVDTKSGESVAARRVEGDQAAALADAVLEGVLPVLAVRCGADVSSAIQSVTELTTTNPRAYQYFVAGTLAYERRELDKAIDLFGNAVALDSTFALAYFELAKAHRARNVYGPARENTESAWRWRSRLSIQDRMQLEAWRDQINYRVVDAIGVYRELHTRWPDDKGILEELSYQLFYWWFHSECLDVTRRAMALYPDEADFVFYYEIMLAFLDRPREALEAAHDLVSRFPENPNHWDELALRFIEAGFPDSAEVTYQRVLAIEPDFFASQRGLAALAYYRGDLNGAIYNLEQFVGRPDLSRDRRYTALISTTAPVGFSFLCYEAGRYERALEIFNEAGRSRNDPVDRHYHQRYYCRLLLRVGRAEEVLRWTDLVADELATGGGTMDNPQLAGITRWTVLELRTMALVAMDSLAAGSEAALEWVESASEFGNDVWIKALYTNAQIALKEGDAAAALAALDQIRQESVGHGRTAIEYREMRAEAYVLAGRLEDAAAVHKELLRVYGGHAVSHYQLGSIYEEMGRSRDAKQEFTRFLEMWDKADEGLPQLVDARSRLAELTKTSP
jgi:tetratricopeptide (TPR) repeat protein/predicted Ser/Thr protein kinase